MASKRRIRRKQCQNKIRFATMNEAQQHMIGMKKRTRSETYYSVYGCSFCGGFHFGHQPSSIRQKETNARARDDAIKFWKNAMKD